MTKLRAQTPSRGPLHGLRIIEFAGIGPASLAGMLLADMGADVIVIDSAAEVAPAERHRRVAVNRGKRSIALDLNGEAGRETAWKLLKSADALIEGLPPGVMDQLGLGADAVAARQPRLVYGRISGWEPAGPLAQAAGHAINPVAPTGLTENTPVTVPAIVGEMAGGAMSLAFGMVCALHEAQSSGRGQVVEAAMIDAVAAMSPLVQDIRSNGSWPDDSPFSGVLEGCDGQRQPAPAPRLSRTPARQPAPGAWCGEHSDEILAELAAAGVSRVSADSQRTQNRPALASAYATSNYL